MTLVPLPAPVVRMISRLGRSLLTWIVVAELCIILALGVVAWHFISTLPSSPTQNPGQADSEPLPSQLPPPLFTPMPKATRSPRPGSGQPSPGPQQMRDPMQLPVDLDTLNRDLARWEAQQWALIKALTAAVQDYLEKVVLPAVLRAEEHVHSS